MEPPDFPTRTVDCQGMKHGKEGRRANPRTQEDERRRALCQGKAAPRSACLHGLADAQLVLDVSAGDAVILPLDTYSVRPVI